jgi:hypothetical protein
VTPARRRHEPVVPAKPFADWLQAKYAEYETSHAFLPSGHSGFVPLGPSERLAGELGWGDNQAGVRRLYRYRHQLAERHSNKRRRMGVAETYLRSMVENACHRYDPELFAELYPELADDIVLEPDAWCPFCQDLVTPIDGLCPWCVCEHGHLFREVGITEDGFACLACQTAERHVIKRGRETRKAAA